MTFHFPFQVKQGYLYKKSVKTLNKDWKKKYVTLTTDGCLTYHPTLHDYMEDVHGKMIPLKHTTVKIPGQKPRCSRASNIPSNNGDITQDLNNLAISGGKRKEIFVSYLILRLFPPLRHDKRQQSSEINSKYKSKTWYSQFQETTSSQNEE